jgi:hypothetical protein
VLPVVY